MSDNTTSGDSDIISDLFDGLISAVSSMFAGFMDFVLSLSYALFYSVVYLLYSVVYGYYMALYNVLQPLIDSFMIAFDLIFGFAGAGSGFLSLFPDIVAYLILTLIGLKFVILGLQLILRIIGSMPGGMGGFFKQ